MTVRELIVQLIEMPMEAPIAISIIDEDGNGHSHSDDMEWDIDDNYYGDGYGEVRIFLHE